MIKWLAFMTLLCVVFLFTACAHFKGKETIRNESVTIKNLPDKVPGVDLVQITTETGHIVEVSRASIPKDENGNPYWPVVSVDPNQTIDGAAKTSSMIPGPGTMIGGALSLFLAYTTLNQKKQKQAEIDAKQKEEEKVRLRDKLLIGVGVGVEVATTDGSAKKAIKGLMSKKQQDLFDEITGDKRAKIVAAKLAKA